VSVCLCVDVSGILQLLKALTYRVYFCCGYIFRICESCLHVNVIGSRSRSWNNRTFTGGLLWLKGSIVFILSKVRIHSTKRINISVMFAHRRIPEKMQVLVTVSEKSEICLFHSHFSLPIYWFPGCRLTSLEQSATSRHVCTVTACFLQSS